MLVVVLVVVVVVMVVMVSCRRVDVWTLQMPSVEQRLEGLERVLRRMVHKRPDLLEV